MKEFFKAIEAKSKITDLPSLRILIGKENNLYEGICLDTNISIIYDKEDDVNKATEYIFEKVCIGSLSQFFYANQFGEEYLLSARIEDKTYWDKYNNLFAKVKKKRLKNAIGNFEKSNLNLEDIMRLYAKIDSTNCDDDNSIDNFFAHLKNNFIVNVVFSFLKENKAIPIKLLKQIYDLKE
ncbi:hypothetical protein OFP88_05260 [Brachyspira hyodysenteriae]|uniref:hypothetical protein n=1 Tax=Brachyspira hyodysenteriae TaxID=159 RepID=UPI0022CD6110|nr:hypothetical protein [Brachyspira hyodysenteriae]MCZ9874964.1 hypothetical protein [Brachyspira hyodysenteriae]MCZ9875419.1 hypothetical protein [Brachyspira hyodysenteriae]MCZ9875442.1 hypothetical protein [Brachyspira hyodysenteriae]MCZ9945305.1 hypothetical protein [Brachyspira hyodysenteriae]MCZ9945340.1 hypothetical protein [Brachyspira hyodysenteriae]